MSELPNAESSVYPFTRISTKRPELRYLVASVLAAGMSLLVAAAPGVGKTNLVLELARALATGTAFLGQFPVPHACRVGIWQQDSHPDDYKNILRGLFLSQLTDGNGGYELDGNRDPVIPSEWIERVYCYDDLGIDLSQLPQVSKMIETIKGEQLDVVVLDSLSMFHTAEEGTNNKEMGLVLRGLKRIARETEAAVVLIHHVTKASSNKDHRVTIADINKIRGTSAIAANVDGVLIIEPTGGDPESPRVVRNIRSRRVRTPQFQYTFTKRQDQHGNDVVSIAAVDLPELPATVNLELERVRMAFSGGGAHTVKEIGSMTRLGSKATRLIGILREQGYIHEVEKRGRASVYARKSSTAALGDHHVAA